MALRHFTSKTIFSRWNTTIEDIPPEGLLPPEETADLLNVHATDSSLSFDHEGPLDGNYILNRIKAQIRAAAQKP